MEITNATTIIQGQSLQKALNSKQLQASNSIASLKNGSNGTGASLPIPGLSSLQLQAKTSLTSQAHGSNQVSQAHLQKIKSKTNISLGLNAMQGHGNSNHTTQNTQDDHKYKMEGGPHFISYDMKIGDVSKYNFRGASSSHAAAGSQSQTSIQGRGSSQDHPVESNLLNRRISQQRNNGDHPGDNSKHMIEGQKLSHMANTHDMAKRSQKRFQPNYNTTNGGNAYTEGNEPTTLPRLSGNSIAGQATAIGIIPNSVTNDMSKNNQLAGTTRKMSLAAKSGQMQVFNSLQSQNLNSAAAPPLHPGSRTGIIAQLQGTSHSSHGARTTMADGTGAQLPPRGPLNLGVVDLLATQPLGKMPIPAYGQVAAGTQRGAVASLPPSFKSATSQKTTIYSNGGNTTGNGSASVKASGPPTSSTQGLVLGGIENTAQERMKMNSGGAVGFDDPQGNSRQDNRAGVRQFESYLQRRQIIQQQREKKQELLKQLDSGMVNKSERNTVSGLADTKENACLPPQNTLLDGLRVDGYSQQQPLQQPLKPSNVDISRKVANHGFNGVSHGHSNSMNVSGNTSANQQTLLSERVPPIGAQTYYGEGSIQQNPANQAAVQLEYNTAPQQQNGQQILPNQAQIAGPTSSAGMYYSSISPTRAQKYLMHQHQQQRGPVPLALSNMSNSVQATQQSVQSTKNLPETSLIKIQSGQDQFNNAVLARNRFKGSIIQSTQANILPIQMNMSTGQPLGQVDSNIFIAPPQKQNSNDFGQYLQYQLHSPNHKMQPIQLEQASLQGHMYQLQQSNEKAEDLAQQEQPRKDMGYSRPHKIYDYMFIQMSNELFQKEYAGRKILVTSLMNQDKDGSLTAQSPKGNKKSPNKTPEKGRFASMPPGMISPTSNNNGELFDLNGIVKIKAYESQLTDELPQVQCNLQPTQLDHLKVLVCEQEDKNHPKLTTDAQNRFEIEKQNQIKQYMEDIIAKLQQKERRFKVTVKRKFVDDALYNSTQVRVASVYVIVINRDKTFDPLLNQRFFKSRKRISNQRMIIESSSEDEDTMLENMDPASREEYLKQQQQQRLKDIGQRRSANSNLVNSKKRSLYESDNGYSNFENMNTTSTSTNMPNFKKLMQDKSQNMSGLGIQQNRNNNMAKQKRLPGIQTGPNLRRNIKKDDEFSVAYKYTPMVKDFSKYGATKIRICQDVQAHAHHLKHPINVFFNQYNEFIKIVLKNQKLQNPSNNNSSGPVYKFNYNYAFGLARALGMILKKDAFSETNMKSREYVNTLKEKLIACMWRKLNESNKDLTPQLADSSFEKMQNEEELRVEAETIDSSNNTPKSKSQLNKLMAGESQMSAQQANGALDVKFAIQPAANTIYKYFIGKGNNSIMVRSLFKNRYWWVQHDKESLENCNFCWTQIRKVNVMEALQCKFPTKKSGIKNVNYNPKVENPPGSAPGTMSSILATPQSKSGKKKRQASQSLHASDKSSKLDASASGTVECDGVTTSAGCAIYKGTAGEKQSEEQFIKKMVESKLYNKIEDNFHLNNKKALFLNMKNYYEALEQEVFDNLPVTFHVKSGLSDPEFDKFKSYYYKTEENIKNKKAALKQKKKEQVEQKKAASSLGDVEDKDVNSPSQSPEKNNGKEVEEKEIQYYTSPLPARNIWIIKPGENTNRGHGIQVARDFDEIKSIICDSTTGGRRTCIVQKYIHNPLLINRRKFDIRTFVLMTSVNGNLKVYIYDEGYLRTSCREYSIHNLSNKLVHLTNDAVQKRAEDYGKYEPGNKLSYNEFQMYFDKNYPDLNICFERDIKPQMNKMTADIFRACYNKLDPKRRLNTMEVFGLDFMIDDEFRSYLIEVNTNPCLELSCPLLARLIPNMLENALKLSLDSQFLPPEHFSSKKAFIGDACPENRFELVFDVNVDGPVLDTIFKTKQNIIIEMDEDELSEEEEHDDE